MEHVDIVKMTGISKAFPGVKALNRVNLTVKKGEVHGLVGENGAGKSTLIKILMGAYQKDEGQIFVDGQEVEITGPAADSVGSFTVALANLGAAIIVTPFVATSVVLQYLDARMRKEGFDLALQRAAAADAENRS